MAATFVMANILVALLTQQTAEAACDPTQSQGCQMESQQNQQNQQHLFLARRSLSGVTTGPSSKPAAEVETTIMSTVQISNPLTFDLDRYVEAVKNATGVAQLPKATVKSFGITVQFVLPNATLPSEAKAAFAKANNVLDSQVKVTDWITNWRRLPLSVVRVTITVLDKSKAAAVQTSAGSVAALESEIHGHVSIAPEFSRTTAEVETKVKSSPSAAAQLVRQIEIASSAACGSVYSPACLEVGIIRAEVKEDVPQRSTSGASSNFHIALAALLIVLRAIRDQTTV